MTSRRKLLIPVLAVLVAAVLTQFQNCAPPSPSGSTQDSDGGVRLIDDFSKVEIQFAAPDVQVSHLSADAEISGLCNRSRNGAALKWSLWAQTGEVMEQGTGICQRGGFVVRIPDLAKLECGADHQLVIESDWGATAFTSFIRRCRPEGMEVLAILSGAPAGTQCNLELTRSSAGGTSCVEACYRGGLLVSSLDQADSRCAAVEVRR